MEGCLRIDCWGNKKVLFGGLEGRVDVIWGG